MGAVDLDPVEADLLGVGGGFGVGGNTVLDVFLAHCDWNFAIAGSDGRRGIARHLAVRLYPPHPLCADMPNLRDDLRPARMDLFYDATPSGESGVAVDVGYAVIAIGSLVLDKDAFGDDQSDAAFRAPPIIGRHVIARRIAGTLAPGHGGHDDAIGKAYTLDGDGLKQNVDIRAHDVSLIVIIDIFYNRIPTQPWLIRHSPDAIQIRGNRIIVPLQRKLHPVPFAVLR